VEKIVGRYPLVNDPTRNGSSAADSGTCIRIRIRAGTHAGAGTLALALI